MNVKLRETLARYSYWALDEETGKSGNTGMCSGSPAPSPCYNETECSGTPAPSYPAFAVDNGKKP